MDANVNRQTLKTMKTKLKILIAALCGLSITTAVLGQTTHIWTGGGDGVDIDSSTNWDGTVPTSSAGDIGEWNGTPGGNLLLTHNSSGPLNSGTPGVNFHLTASQTGSVNISSRVSGSANIAQNAITIDSGAGAFSEGDGSANVLNIILRPSSSGAPFPIHLWANNSANAARIFPNVRYQSGGGNPHTIQFDGTGDWIVNNALNNANAGNNNNFLVKTGSGTLFWNPNSITGAAGVNGIGSPLDLEGGRLVLTASTTALGTQRITNNAVLQYDAATSQTLSGPIDGTGIVRVSNGTLTLSSAQSDFTGSVDLTNNGVLVVGGAQNVGGTGPLGVGSTIFFNGGTLQFSAANAFDYSPRFSTAANQAYKFDTAAQNVTFTNALTSVGGTFTKLGSGVLTLAGANTYNGLTAVGGGKLVIQGSAGSGGIVVSNSAVLGVTATGTAITPTTLTVGTTGSAILEFNNISSTTLAPIAAGTISVGGPITVNIASGSFSVGQSYPLFTWTSGSAPAVTLGTLTGAVGNLSTNGSKIQLNVTGLAYVWTGNTGANWDTTTPNNWKVNGVPQVWADGSAALFDDTAPGETNVSLNSAVSPASTTVNSSLKIYSIVSSGPNAIVGSGGLTKNGNSILTLSGGGANTYTGPTIISGGTLTFNVLANGDSPSDIGQSGNSAANLVLNGGTLQYTGVAQDSDRLFTLGTGNGTIDSSGFGAVILSNPGNVALSGTGTRTLTLTGSDADDNTIAAFIGDNGGATSLAKSGSGKWILTGNNTNSGTVTIAAGTLQVGDGGTRGAVGSGNVVDNGRLSFNTSGAMTNGTITGTGSVTVDGGGTVVLPGNNTYSGATTINGSTLQIGNGGASGTLNSGASIVNNGTLIYNSTSTLNLGGLFGAGITGGGNVIVRKGTLQAIGNNNYSGWTQIDPGATFEPSVGNVGLLASSVVTNNGTLLLSRQDNNIFIYSGDIVGTGAVTKIANNGNSGDVTLKGVNTYTGGTYILGGTIIFGDNGTPGAGSFVGDVFLTNDYAHNQFGTPPNDFVPATLTFNRPDDFTFPGVIAGEGFVTLNGAAIVTLTGNNTYTNRGTGPTTTITSGALQVGNGGLSGTIGFGGVAMTAGALAFDRAGTLTVFGPITGSGGAVVQEGPGTTILVASNTYSGPLTVSNGVLVVNATGGDLNLYGGTLAAGSLTVPTNLFVTGALNLFSGNVMVTLNKSLTQSNSFISAGGFNYVGGGLLLTNVGPSVAVGDRFVIFNQLIVGAHTMPIISPNFTVRNDIDIDGSVTVTAVSQPPAPTLSKVSLSNGTNIVITATNNAGNAGGTWSLLSTNNLTAPLSTWPVIRTGTFTSGLVSITNTVNTNQQYFILRVP